ncbi:MAG: hypothetical protein MMC23_006308 [Stictis urceolatum]|nr:hypothetical protein [Stictis urceolata]
MQRTSSFLATLSSLNQEIFNNGISLDTRELEARAGTLKPYVFQLVELYCVALRAEHSDTQEHGMMPDYLRTAVEQAQSRRLMQPIYCSKSCTCGSRKSSEMTLTSLEDLHLEGEEMACVMDQLRTALAQSDEECHDPQCGNRFTIILLGDSQITFSTDHLHCPLLRKYVNRAEVLNWGSPGYNSTLIRKYLKILMDSQPTRVKLFLILIGSNDASTNSKQHVPIDQYEENMLGIMDDLKARYPFSECLIISPPPTGTGAPADFANGDTEQYAAAAMKAAESRGALTCDLYAVLETNPDEFLKADGLHLNEVGYTECFRLVLNEIESSAKEGTRPSKARKTLPRWTDA